MISSVQNTKIKQYVKLKQKKYRDKWKLFIVEGFHLVTEAQKAGLVVEIFSTTIQEGTTLVSENVFQKLSYSLNPQGILAVCHKKSLQNFGEQIILLDNLQDPGNVGNIIRSAKSFGFSDVVVQGVDLYNFKTIAASQGALFGINTQNIESSKEFLEAHSDFEIIGTVLDPQAKELDMVKSSTKMIIVFGNEGQGISYDALTLLKQKIYIPINFESLNVASTAAIVLHHFQRRK